MLPCAGYFETQSLYAIMGGYMDLIQVTDADPGWLLSGRGEGASRKERHDEGGCSVEPCE